MKTILNVFGVILVCCVLLIPLLFMAKVTANRIELKINSIVSDIKSNECRGDK